VGVFVKLGRIVLNLGYYVEEKVIYQICLKCVGRHFGRFFDRHIRSPCLSIRERGECNLIAFSRVGILVINNQNEGRSDSTRPNAFIANNYPEPWRDSISRPRAPLKEPIPLSTPHYTTTGHSKSDRNTGYLPKTQTGI
jgi:hypothetical protein